MFIGFLAFGAFAGFICGALNVYHGAPVWYAVFAAYAAALTTTLLLISVFYVAEIFEQRARSLASPIRSGR